MKPTIRSSAITTLEATNHKATTYHAVFIPENCSDGPGRLKEWVLGPAHRIDVEKSCRRPHDQLFRTGLVVFLGSLLLEEIQEVEYRELHQLSVSLKHELLPCRIEPALHIVGIRTSAAVVVKKLVDYFRRVIVHAPNRDSRVERARHGAPLGGTAVVVMDRGGS